MISTGMGSGSEPESTVHAYPFIPGLRSASLKIWTLPALGRMGVAGSWLKTTKEHARATASAANFCMGPSLILLMKHLSAFPIIVQIFDQRERVVLGISSTAEGRCGSDCSRPRDPDPTRL